MKTIQWKDWNSLSYQLIKDITFEEFVDKCQTSGYWQIQCDPRVFTHFGEDDHPGIRHPRKRLDLRER
jgi:hypothetical protein